MKRTVAKVASGLGVSGMGFETSTSDEATSNISVTILIMVSFSGNLSSSHVENLILRLLYTQTMSAQRIPRKKNPPTASSTVTPPWISSSEIRIRNVKRRRRMMSDFWEAESVTGGGRSLSTGVGLWVLTRLEVYVEDMKMSTIGHDPV